MRGGLAVLLTLAAAVLWGTSFNVNDAGLRVLHPATFSAWRFLLGAAASVALAIALRAFDPRLLRSPGLWLLAGLQSAAFLLQYVGQTDTTPARAALFTNASVVFVALFSWVLLRRPPRAGTLVAMGVALVGVALLQLGPARGLGGGSIVGDAVVLLGGTFGAAYIVLQKRALGEEASVWNAMACLFVAIAAVTFAVAFVVAPADALVPAFDGWWAIAYAGLFTTTGAYTLWALGLTRLSATASTVLLLVEVLVASGISTAIGRETLPLLALAGGALLLGAVGWLAAREANEDQQA